MSKEMNLADQQLERIREVLFVREDMAKMLRIYPGDNFAIDMFVAADSNFWSTLRDIFGTEPQAEKGPRRLS